MARFIIIENRTTFDLATQSDDGVAQSDEPHIWLWDDTKPSERVYLGGNSPAYVVGNRVSWPGSTWSPKPDELVFKEFEP